MFVLLRVSDGDDVRAEVGEPSADGVVFVRLPGCVTVMPFKATGLTSDDDLPVFEYAM